MQRRAAMRSLFVVALVLAALVGRPAPTPGAAEVPDCTPTATLVNPCRPWLGAVADNYPGITSWKGQVLAHEERIGRRVDVVHGYHPPGSVKLLADERFLVERGTILYLNWKPAHVWKDAAGGKAAITTQIDTFATQLASVKPRKIMLSLFGEPERYATPGTSACPGLKGTAGSPQDYKDMWAFIQARFAAKGATNIVWVMNYLGYDGWDCLFPELWPGNDRVDWITWDPYVGPRERWNEEVGYFYEALEERTDAAHAFTSKPWGIAEFGYWYGTNQAEAYRMYDDARAFLNSGGYPRIKLYEVYDEVSEGWRDTRTSYTANGVYDPLEQARYNAFANDPIFTDPVPAPTTTTTTTTTTTQPPTTLPAPTDHLAGCDTSVESGLSCFGGMYSATVAPRLFTSDGHTGTDSVSVTNTQAATGEHGLNLKPAPVSATQVGRTYRASVWVRASRVGLPVTLLLRERRANGTAPGYRSVTWTATSTEWQRLDATYVGEEAGNGLTFSVYGSQMATGQWIRADDFSLTSLPG
jgi:hypothetical protein